MYHAVRAEKVRSLNLLMKENRTKVNKLLNFYQLQKSNKLIEVHSMRRIGRTCPPQIEAHYRQRFSEAESRDGRSVSGWQAAPACEPIIDRWPCEFGVRKAL